MSFAAGFNPDQTFTATELETGGKGFSLGDVVEDHAGRKWIFVVADSSISAGRVCQIADDLGAAHVSTSNAALGMRLGVAKVAIAGGSYGWLQIYGQCPAIQVGASAAANAQLNTTATAGQLDDDGANGAAIINGIVLTTTNGGQAGTAPGVLNFPTVGPDIPS